MFWRTETNKKGPPETEGPFKIKLNIISELYYQQYEQFR